MSRCVEILRPRVPHAMTLAAALVAGEFLRNVQVVSASPGEPHVAAAIEAFSNWFLLAFTIMAIISACESLLQFGWRRVLVQTAALASGTVAYSYWVGTSPLLTIQYRSLGMEIGPPLFMYIVWMGWAMSALLSGFYRAHEKARTASAALRGAELARERTQQRLLESRLQVLEAQVEPRFLFDALSRVQRLYEQDPGRADEALDDLIGYLRAALPQQRERASTLGREFSLVESYTRIVSTASHCIRRPDAALENTYAPPMVLLPIVQLALSAGAAATRIEQSVGMHVVDSPGRTAVQVEFTAAADWDPDSQARSLRATMALLFGAEGRLVISTAGTKTMVSVSWPAIAPAPEPSLRFQPA